MLLNYKILNWTWQILNNSLFKYLNIFTSTNVYTKVNHGTDIISQKSISLLYQPIIGDLSLNNKLIFKSKFKAIRYPKTEINAL